MNLRDGFGFLCLLVGVGASLVGLGAVMREIPWGWPLLVVGIVANVLSYRLMRARPSTT